MTEPTQERTVYDAAERAHLRREFFATKPTTFTRIWRVLFPYQVWRFIAINTKMIRMISRNHKGH